MINILINSTYAPRFLPHLNFARSIVKATKDISFYFYISNEVYAQYRIEVDNLEFTIVNKPTKYSLVKINKFNKFKNFLKKKIKNYFIVKQIQKCRKELFNKIKYTFLFTKKFKEQEKKLLNNLQKNYEELKKIIQQHKINILIISGDRHGGEEAAFLKISKKFKIPSIIPYFVFHSFEDHILKLKWYTKKIKPSIFTSSYIINSQNNLKYRMVNGKYYYDHPTANALHKFGVMSQNPWVMGSGFSDILCLNNQSQKKIYICRGVEKNKIKVVGNIFYDDLYKQYLNKTKVKKNIIQKYKLNKSKKIIIISLPPYAEHGFISWDRQWKELNFLFKNICELNQNILISLHPKNDKEIYKHLESKYNVRILEESLINVLSSADMFVSEFSTTVEFSILCGVKTVLIDTVNLNFKHYNFLKSCKIVKKKSYLKNILAKTLNSKVNFDLDWKNLSKQKVFDGKTIDRYISLFLEVGQNRKSTN